MATLEDKILGEKLHYYCSSSEDESSDVEEGKSEVACAKDNTSSNIQTPEPYKWEGSSTNTGPKGVVKDWQRFKQLEAEKRVEQEKEKIMLIKKLSLTCQSALDEERDKQAQEDPEIAELLADGFLLEYQKQRMQEMMAHLSSLPQFGKVIELQDTQQFLDAVDKENKSVTVIIHIYEDGVDGCEAMNGCLISLSQDYVQVKFCKLKASIAGLSRLFKVSGVPALLVYKGGLLVGNFVRIIKDLGDDFFAEDVESFLLEHGMLPDKTCVPSIVRSQDDDDDSDLSVE